MSKLIETEEAARRRARTTASDIEVYNAAKIDKAVREDNVFEALEDEIAEGREYFRKSLTSALHDKIASKKYFERAIVDIWFKKRASLETKMW